MNAKVLYVCIVVASRWQQLTKSSKILKYNFLALFHSRYTTSKIFPNKFILSHMVPTWKSTQHDHIWRKIYYKTDYVMAVGTQSLTRNSEIHPVNTHPHSLLEQQHKMDSSLQTTTPLFSFHLSF